jgi:hypothetical protein
MFGWQPIGTAPELLEIVTKIDDAAGPRNEQTLVRRGRLWWSPDGAMYVYYTPTHWKPAVERDTRTIDMFGG